MAIYKIFWTIDIPAESPIAAAKEALKIQREDSFATVFQCLETETNTLTSVDLDHDESEIEFKEEKLSEEENKIVDKLFT